MSIQVVNLWACGLDHPLPTGAEVKERVELYLYPHLLFRVNFTAFLYNILTR
jgi:hypothetical protein